MEALLITLVLSIPLLILATFIMALLALSRQKKLRSRLKELESAGLTGRDAQQLREMEKRLRALEEKLQGQIPPAEVDHEEPATPEEELPPELQPTPVEEPPPVMPRVETPPRPPVERPPIERPASIPPAATTSTRPPETHKGGSSFHFNIEEWVGVRGAAAAGGVVLALAALLFFQYSIEHGLITPLMRVVAGIITGLIALSASEYLIRRSQEAAANALAGAGIVILYASTWAAENLYELIGPLPAFILMVVITAFCITLAISRSSAFIAILGLAGGFATPLLISAPTTGPIALFGYLLLLDLALLWLARMKRWPLLAILCLAGTGLHQALWIARSLSPEQAVLGLGMLLLFGLIFLFLSPSDDTKDGLWRLTRAAGIAIPFIFGLHFAARASLEISPFQLGLFLVVLSAGACFLALRQIPAAAASAALASAGMMALFLNGHHLDTLLAWQAVGAFVSIFAVFFLADLIDGERRSTISWASVIAGLSFLIFLVPLPDSRSVSQPWPWVLGWACLAGALIYISRRDGFSALHLPAAVLPAFGLAVAVAAHAHDADAISAPSWAALILSGPLLLSLGSALWSHEKLGRRMNQAIVGAALALIPATWALAESFHLHVLILAIILALLLSLLGSIASTRLSSGVLYLAVVIGGAVAHSALWDFGRASSSVGNTRIEILALLGLSTLFFVLWPSLATGAFRSTRAAWWAAALAPFLYFPVLRQAWRHVFGSEMIAILPISLAVACLGVFAGARKHLPEDSRGRRSAEVWYLASTLCLIALAIPLQLDREWITIGWAINAFALVLLWKYLDHPGLKYLALLLFGAVGLRLLFNPAVLSYHQPGSIPLLNWLSYTYLAPAAALIGARRIMSELEVSRQRPRELSLPGGGRPILGTLYGLSAIAVIFAWINLSIAEYFSSGRQIILSLDRMPARDLSTSVAWALYAVALLILGVKSQSSSLRWLSLSLMLATLSKVFLHDLGSLQDLYRVASLVGLALSLIVVSLIYQRFVFSASKEESE